MNSQIEADLLRQLLPELEAEGYEVYLQPSRPLLPAFLATHVPDAIALRSDKNLAIEVVHKSPQAAKKLERIARLFEGQEGWELRIIWARPTSTQPALQVQKSKTMQKRVAEVRQLASSGHLEPALLLAWATFEALARAVAPGQFERPQTPGRLVEILANDGYLTPSEADQLRRLAEKRNRLVHGGLEVRVSNSELERFAGVLEIMLQMIRH